MRELIARDPSLWLSRSWTTRACREGEAQDAYRFVDRPTFEEHAAAGGFLEHAEFLGNLYGTPWPEAPEGTDVVLEIDVQGAAQVVAREPGALFVFLLPPSPEEQHRRLLGRGDEADKAAERVEVAAREHELAGSLGAVEIVNDELDATVDLVQALIADARAAPAASDAS